MKFRQVLFFLIAPLIADLILVSCCDCPTPQYSDFSQCNLTVYNIDNAGREPVVSEKDTVLKEAFGLKLSIELKENFCNNSKPFLFSSSAYAFSCHCDPEFTYQPLDSLVSIRIYTLNDFDKSHTSNSEISEYFEPHFFHSITEFIQLSNHHLSSLKSEGNSCVLLLTTPPETIGQHQFKVVLSYNDGKTFEVTSREVYLN